MISAKNYSLLPDVKTLQMICKAISVLDAIICPEWEYRYYSYNSKWSDDEEFFEMRNGSGDHMLMLFSQKCSVINGFIQDAPQPDIQKVTADLPSVFEEFIFGEPVHSIGTTFCLWTTEPKSWHTGESGITDDHLQEMLHIFDGNPQTYINWATGYFEDSYKASGIPLETVTRIYNGEVLTKEMVLTIVGEPEDWDQLEEDLTEADYPYSFD
ncbi:MAG: hypothetical protein LBE92_17195 [Chryseobacterium sp.]|jgi:hypothetical protein|uniref:hypothetical protein n=1 Tax=Chryseobacterium sp. TaxID=1871047 RepID=UPI0028351D93|nr:hypothetical protein [Chryseobacterium sp.]MDR2237862.1 hypothetical protein [Chryseobacterium sp.]